MNLPIDDFQDKVSYSKQLNMNIGNKKKLTMEGDFKDEESRAGVTTESEGLWNSKWAIDRSIGFVSVSMSIYPVHLKIQPIKHYWPKTDAKKKKKNLLHVLLHHLHEGAQHPC